MAVAQPDSTLVEHKTIWNTTQAEAWKNPALYGKAFTLPYSELALSLDYDKQTTAFVLQQGTGHTLYNIEANTFLRMSDNAAVWGKASYMNGVARNIRFSSVADYELLEPYILADTDGGKTKRERYVFEGGYATQLDKWLIGAEMLFRAEHEYRTYDPRMRAIVTDLTLRAGAAYQTSAYNWGAAAQLNIYKQTESVKFMREVGALTEYQMTGLGTIYARFSGEVNNLYFKGGGLQLLLNAQPRAQQGLFGNLSLGSHHYERVAASLNSLPLTKLYRDELHLQAGWKQQKNTDMAFFLDAKLTKRAGNENIVGSSLSNNYSILATLTMYKNAITDINFNALYGRNGHTDWHVQLKGGYLKNNEKYMEPKREIDYSQLYTQLNGQYICQLGKQTTLTCQLQGGFFKNLDSKMNIPVVNTEPSLLSMLNHNYKYLKADNYSADAAIRVDYHIRNTHYATFAAVSGGAIGCSEDGKDSHLAVTLGMTF